MVIFFICQIRRVTLSSDPAFLLSRWGITIVLPKSDKEGKRQACSSAFIVYTSKHKNKHWSQCLSSCGDSEWGRKVTCRLAVGHLIFTEVFKILSLPSHLTKYSYMAYFNNFFLIGFIQFFCFTEIM